MPPCSQLQSFQNAYKIIFTSISIQLTLCLIPVKCVALQYRNNCLRNVTCNDKVTPYLAGLNSVASLRVFQKLPQSKKKPLRIISQIWHYVRTYVMDRRIDVCQTVVRTYEL